MTRTKIILGMALAASLASLAPAADAAPVAASRAAVAISATDGSVMQDVIQVSTHPTRRHRHRKGQPAHK
ncbi:hypothetical protein [uncultured Rhodoblastus sp.]|uniref:hypothetical protein n=1 Tax=uncultured Rhodoblastus sp. TaxID=543037 RepID=UPI0025F308DC|nr:hypothetical protein [uncultured Rhodoblastus sp.]